MWELILRNGTNSSNVERLITLCIHNITFIVIVVNTVKIDKIMSCYNNRALG